MQQSLRIITDDSVEVRNTGTRDVFAGSVFSFTFLKLIAERTGAFFIQYLAHCSFKDFALWLIVFIEALIMSFKALSTPCQEMCVFMRLTNLLFLC